MQVAASHAAQDVGKAAQYSDSLIAEKSVKVGSRFVSTETTAEEHSMTYRLQHVSVPRPPGSDQRTRAFYGALLGLQEIPAPVHNRHRRCDLVQTQRKHGTSHL